MPYDLIIIDTPPGSGAQLANALTASDSVVLTAQADAYSYQGLDTLAAQLEAMPSDGRPEAVGIVVSRFNPRTRMGARMLAMFEAKAPELGRRCKVHTVRECVAVQEACLAGRALYDYAPKSNAAADYLRCADAVLEAAKVRGARRWPAGTRGWRRRWPIPPSGGGPRRGGWRPARRSRGTPRG